MLINRRELDNRREALNLVHNDDVDNVGDYDDDDGITCSRCGVCVCVQVLSSVSFVIFFKRPMNDAVCGIFAFSYFEIFRDQKSGKKLIYFLILIAVSVRPFCRRKACNLLKLNIKRRSFGRAVLQSVLELAYGELSVNLDKFDEF